MRSVRLLYKDSETQARAVFKASEVTPENHDLLKLIFDYACRNPVCDARFTYRGEIHPLGNGATLPATFPRIPGTNHLMDCPYKPRELHIPPARYEEDGQWHIRLNFPIGAAWDDRLPPQSDQEFYDRLQKAGDAPRVKKMPVQTLHNLVNVLEKIGGSLESVPANTDFAYQDNVYRWPDLFIAADRYETLYQKAYGRTYDENPPAFIVVKPQREIASNESGKRRFACEAQYMRFNKTERSITPVLVCTDPALAESLSQVIAKDMVLLVAARPHPSQKYQQQHGAVNVYLTVHDVAQLSRLDPQKYWRYAPSKKHQAELFPGLTAS